MLIPSQISVSSVTRAARANDLVTDTSTPGSNKHRLSLNRGDLSILDRLVSNIVILLANNIVVSSSGRVRVWSGHNHWGGDGGADRAGARLPAHLEVVLALIVHELLGYSWGPVTWLLVVIHLAHCLVGVLSLILTTQLPMMTFQVVLEVLVLLPGDGSVRIVVRWFAVLLVHFSLIVESNALLSEL